MNWTINSYGSHDDGYSVDAVEAILKSVQETAGMSEAEGLKLEFEIGWPIFATNDSKEGPRAFAEKRAPNWTRT